MIICDEELTISEIMAFIDAEIRWCLAHPDRNFSGDFRKGFTNGLIQAKYLITEAKRKKARGEFESEEARQAVQRGL